MAVSCHASFAGLSLLGRDTRRRQPFCVLLFVIVVSLLCPQTERQLSSQLTQHVRLHNVKTYALVDIYIYSFFRAGGSACWWLRFLLM